MFNNKFYTSIKAIVAIMFVTTSSVMAQSTALQTEKDFYSLKTIAIPQDIKLEVGGIAVMPDGRVAVSTRRGEIWIIQNAYKSGIPYFSKFASGLHEVLGLAYHNGAFIALNAVN